MLLIENLKVLIPALKLSRNTLFGIVTTFDKLFALLVPDLIGFGRYLYPLAIGLKKILSKP